MRDKKKKKKDNESGAKIEPDSYESDTSVFVVGIARHLSLFHETCSQVSCNRIGNCSLMSDQIHLK